MASLASSVWDRAAREGRLDDLKILAEHHPTLLPIDHAIAANQLDVVKWWHENGGVPTRVEVFAMVRLYSGENNEMLAYLCTIWPWLRSAVLMPRHFDCVKRAAYPTLNISREELETLLAQYLDKGNHMCTLLRILNLGAHYAGTNAFVQAFLENASILLTSVGKPVDLREAGVFFCWPLLPRLANWPVCRPSPSECQEMPRVILLFCASWLLSDALAPHLHFAVELQCLEYLDFVTVDKNELTKLLTCEPE